MRRVDSTAEHQPRQDLCDTLSEAGLFDPGNPVQLLSHVVSYMYRVFTCCNHGTDVRTHPFT